MNIEELIILLTIVEDNRKIERKSIFQLGANFVEIDLNVVNKKRKIYDDTPRRDNSKNAKKFKDNLYNCEKAKLHLNECQKPKKNAQVNVVERYTLSKGIQEMTSSAEFLNVIMLKIQGNGRLILVLPVIFAQTRPCSQITKKLNGEKLFMKNFVSFKVEGQGKVTLKMTSGKEFVINNILHVSDIYKNLVFEFLLNKNSFKLLFISDKFVITKNKVYVSKGYLCDEMFKIVVLTIALKLSIMNKILNSTYMLKLSC